MSLLLDALKKAAEQKEKQAEAAKSDTSSAGGDTIVPDETQTELIDSGDNTEISEVNYKEVVLPADANALAEQLNYGAENEDTQIIPIDDTVYDQTVFDEHDSTTEYHGDEDTQLSASAYEEQKIAAEDESENTVVIETNDNALMPSFDEDQTMSLLTSDDLSEIEYHGDEDTQVTADPYEEQTRVEFEDVTKDVSENTVIVETNDETLTPGFDEDQTMSALTSDDVSDFLDESAVAAEIDEVVEEDLSLYLAEQELGDDTVTTNARALETKVQLLANRAADTEDPELAGYRQQESEQTSTVTANPAESTVTAGIEFESLRNENTILRQDSTSTNTYAPDNYDRTLIRSVSEDESKFFAGMKSEEDVLMTPDYAKRVFLSKSSASRSHLYRLYAGIAVIIMLAISIYAAIELEHEITQIDNSLVQLKRDPMPGLIKNLDTEKSTNLFENEPNPDIDSKTLKLVENAQLEVVVAGNDAVADSPQVANNVSKLEAEVEKEEAVSTAESEKSTSSQVAEVVQPVKQDKPRTTNQQSSNSLKIITDSRPAEKDQWLAEAYQAYQKGDDEAALEKYNRVLALEPNNRNALLARAAISIQNADIKSAIDDYRSLLLVNPKDSMAMSSLISVASISPQHSESQLKLMIREEPESPYLNFVLANVYGLQNRWQEAQGFYFKALEISPEDPNYAYNLAVSLEHIAKPKVAIVYYEKALFNFSNGLATFNKDVVDRRIEVLRRL